MSKTSTNPKSISAEEFDRKVEAGEDVSEYLDFAKATRPGLEPQPVNFELPLEFVQDLDREAADRGMSRETLIKAWLYDRMRDESVRRGKG